MFRVYPIRNPAGTAAYFINLSRRRPKYYPD
jgi:hypothetical protein